MAVKVWVKLQRAVFRDPNWREIGQAIWLLGYMVDRADWATGRILNWRDSDAAEDLQMPVRMVREYRARLITAGRVSCRQGQHSQTVTVLDWIDPRGEGPAQVPAQGNRKAAPSVPAQGNRKAAPSPAQGDTQGDTQGDRKTGLLPLKDQEVINHYAEQTATGRSDGKKHHSTPGGNTGRDTGGSPAGAGRAIAERLSKRGGV